MDARQANHGDTPTGERMGDLGRAKASAVKHKLQGEEVDQHGASYLADPSEVDALLEDWPSAPAKISRQLIDQYGYPNEATPIRLRWYGNGPWKRTEVTRDEIVHNFPTSHIDFLTQTIDYRVPPERFADLARYDGSCLADRTAGEAAARCDSEAMNILTLNLMHEIVSGAKTVEEARHAYAETAAAYTLGRDAPYAERLLFELPGDETADPDEQVAGGAMARQMVGKARDVLGGGEGR